MRRLVLCCFILPFITFSQRSLKIQLSKDKTELTIKYKGKKGDILEVSEDTFMIENFPNDSIEYYNALISHDSLIPAWLYFKLGDGRFIRYYVFDEKRLSEDQFKQLDLYGNKGMLYYTIGNQTKRVRYKLPLIINPEVMKLDPKSVYFSFSIMVTDSNGKQVYVGKVSDECKW